MFGSEDCGCSIPMSSIIESTAVRQEIVEKIKIDKKKFLSGDLVEMTKFAFLVNPVTFNKKLLELGIVPVDIVTDSKLLAKISIDGHDLKGTLKDKEGKPIIFSYIDLLKSIPLNKERIDKTLFNFV